MHAFPPQVAICGDWESASIFEAGLNRSFDMTKILQSHFGEVLASSPGNDGAATKAPTSSGTSRSGGKSGESAAAEDHVLLPLCVFTLYWGIDETPVVVGLRMAGGSGQSGRGAHGGETAAEAMQLHIRHLKVCGGIKGLPVV